jgi:hypothetical protein
MAIVALRLLRFYSTAELKRFGSCFTTSYFDRICHRTPERRMVSIDPTDPHNVPIYGGAHLGGCGNCED